MTTATKGLGRMNVRDVPIPALMKHLPLDRRGYPIIPTVMVDDHGPKFAVNDEAVRQRFIAEERCGICGNPLYRARWLVGGPGSAFLPGGAYLDPPVHTECLHYAMQVCPYLAAPNWKGAAVGPTQAKQAVFDGKSDLIVTIGTGYDKVFPNRPDIFVAVQFVGRVKLHRNEDGLPVMQAPTPFRQIEYWTEGRQLGEAEGQAITLPILERMAAKLAEVYGKDGTLPPAPAAGPNPVVAADRARVVRPRALRQLRR